MIFVNIVGLGSFKEKLNHLPYYDLINFCEDMRSVEPSANTLICGWSLTKELTGLDINILDRKVNDTISWCFSETEDKELFTDELYNYITNIPSLYFEKYSYTPIDPVFKLKSFRELFYEPIEAGYYYHPQRHLYLLSGYDIYGINLELFEYMDIDIETLTRRIKKHVPYIKTDISGSVLRKYEEIIPDFPLLRRYLVVLVAGTRENVKC